MNVNHVTSEGAMGVAEQSLKRAVKSGKWMVAVWAVEDGNINLIDRTTWQFPTGDFKTAVEQLRSVCEKELAAAVGALPDNPLPLAVLGGAGFAPKPAVKEIDIDDVSKELDGEGFGPVEGFEEEEDAEQI